jgi:hypothetical protein
LTAWAVAHSGHGGLLDNYRENGRLCFLYSAETKELVAGYWPWEVQSMQEAID